MLSSLLLKVGQRGDRLYGMEQRDAVNPLEMPAHPARVRGDCAVHQSDRRPLIRDEYSLDNLLLTRDFVFEYFRSAYRFVVFVLREMVDGFQEIAAYLVDRRRCRSSTRLRHIPTVYHC